MGPYVPDKILRAVAAYVHRRNLHPSTSQTAKEFKAYYYHPMADKIIKELCRNCITCTQTRNKENSYLPNLLPFTQNCKKSSRTRTSYYQNVQKFTKSSKRKRVKKVPVPSNRSFPYQIFKKYLTIYIKQHLKFVNYT